MKKIPEIMSFEYGCNEKLLKKYNALSRFIGNRKETIVEYGCMNFEIHEISYKKDYRKNDYIEIKWGEYTSYVIDSRQIILDRKHHLVELYDMMDIYRYERDGRLKETI